MNYAVMQMDQELGYFHANTSHNVLFTKSNVLVVINIYNICTDLTLFILDHIQKITTSHLSSMSNRLVKPNGKHFVSLTGKSKHVLPLPKHLLWLSVMCRIKCKLATVTCGTISLLNNGHIYSFL